MNPRLERTRPSWQQGFRRLPPSERLVGAWLPALGVAGGELPDVSGYGRHGTFDTIDSTAWESTDSADIPGYALRFEGNSGGEHIEMGSDVLLESAVPFTVIMRFNLDDYSDTFPGLLSLKTDGSNGFVIFANTSNGNYRPITCGSRSDSPFALCQPSTDFSSELLGVWTHLAITYDGVSPTSTSSFAFYRNGEGPLAIEAAGSLAAHGNVNYIGREGTTSNRWDGLIADARVYHREFSARQVMQDYAHPLANFRPRRPVLGSVAAAPPSAGTPMHYYRRRRVA